MARWQDSPTAPAWPGSPVLLLPFPGQRFGGREEVTKRELDPWLSGRGCGGVWKEAGGPRPPRQHPESVSWRGARRARRLPSEAAPSRPIFYP